MKDGPKDKTKHHIPHCCNKLKGPLVQMNVTAKLMNCGRPYTVARTVQSTNERLSGSGRVEENKGNPICADIPMGK